MVIKAQNHMINPIYAKKFTICVIGVSEIEKQMECNTMHRNVWKNCSNFSHHQKVMKTAVQDNYKPQAR